MAFMAVLTPPNFSESGKTGLSLNSPHFFVLAVQMQTMMKKMGKMSKMMGKLGGAMPGMFGRR